MATILAHKPLAAVTGASSGIGYELARQFARNGYDLVICADDARIYEAARAIEADGASVEPVQVDLAAPEGVEAFYSAIRQRGVALDAIALNAGIGVTGDFARETDLARELKLVNLNVLSTVHLAKLVVRDMVARGSGRVLITASVAGTMPTPLMAVYGASKAFDLAFAAALHYELQGTGVTVTALVPGPTDTDFFARAGMEDTKAAEEALKNDAADVARQGFEALMQGKDRVMAATSLSTKFQGWTARFTPESIKAAQHRKLSEHHSQR